MATVLAYNAAAFAVVSGALAILPDAADLASVQPALITCFVGTSLILAILRFWR